MLSELSDTRQAVANYSVDLRGRKVNNHVNDVGPMGDMLIDERKHEVLPARGARRLPRLREKQSFIPVEASRRSTDDDVLVNHSQDQIAAAPR